MRSILAGATALLLWGSAVAEPADPTQLAETGAYLLATRIAAAWQMNSSPTPKQRFAT
jgi:hypothetical protein